MRRGFARARGVYVGFNDGDGDIDVDIVPSLARVCQRPGVWAAIASKHAPGAQVHMSPARSVLSRGYRHFVRLLFGLDVSDTQCGAKLFRVRPETRTVFVERFLSRWVFDVEILARYQQLFRNEGKSLAGPRDSGRPDH